MVYLRCEDELPTKTRLLGPQKLTGAALRVQATMHDEHVEGEQRVTREVLPFTAVCPSTYIYARVRTFAGKRKAADSVLYQPLFFL